MKKPILLTLLLTLLSLPGAARLWTAHMSYHNNTFNWPVDGRAWALANGSIFTYAPGDSLVQTFSKASGLSAANISQMAYNADEEAFLLIYSDNNIDVLGINDSITNMPQYKNSAVVADAVNGVTMSGRYAYVATTSGVMVVNMRRREFVGMYSFGESVKSCAAVDGKIVCLTAKGIYLGDTKRNLLDAANWQHANKAVLGIMLPFAGRLYAYAGDGIYRIDPATGAPKRIYQGTFSYRVPCTDCLVMGNAKQVVTMDEDETFTVVSNQPNDFLHVTYDGDNDLFWASRGEHGLQAFRHQGDSLAAVGMAVVPNSPVRNLAYYLAFTPQNRLLIGGGNLNYTGINYPATIMAYEPDGRWINFAEDSIAEKTGIRYLNVTSVAEDPKDPAHHYVSCAGGGVYEFRNGRFVHMHGCDDTPLQTILPDNPNYNLFTRVSGLTYDAAGNLWMINNQVDSVLHVMKADGTWQAFHNSTLAGYPTFDHLLIDSRGWLWATHRRTTAVHHAGIFCFNHNNTLATTGDDQWKFVYQFTNQDNTAYTFNLLYDIAEDRNGQLWIGTDHGPFLLRSPRSFFGNAVEFTQVKVPRNDGTNYADYLLVDEVITAIAIDGGNRKWFGTASNGVYLISADGLETIAHFTAENSPLLSNTIHDIAVNPTTGEVFFGTDAGLISYRSDATEPFATLSESNVKVYPNPVRPGYEGQLRVDGLSFDSDVKVTTATGQVIAQGPSVGGTFTWNLRDKRGHRVSTGVYYIIAADQEGNTGAVAKFVVVK